jgi:DNA (cytosine-5)-methyltransferase 1
MDANSMPKTELFAHLISDAMNNGARSKRPRIDDGEQFAEEERKHHALLEQMHRDTRKGRRSVLRPDADLDALKKAVSLSLREKYGMRPETVDEEEQGSSNVSEELDAPPTKAPRRLKARRGAKRKWGPTHSEQGNADRADSSSSTDSDPDGDSSSSSTDSHSDSDSSSTSRCNSVDEVSVSKSSKKDGLKQRDSSDDTVPDCIDFTIDSSDGISTDSESSLRPLDRQTQGMAEQTSLCKDIQKMPLVGGEQVEQDGDMEDQIEDASGVHLPAETHAPQIHDDDEDDLIYEDDDYGSDLDEDEEERLVKQICLHRAIVSTDVTEDDRPEDTLEAEAPEADAEISEIKYKGRKYQAGKTYYRVYRGERYMYGLLEMYQRPDGSLYAVWAQVLKHSDTFLASIEFPMHDYVRLAGVEKVTIDQTFGKEVVELDGIPEMVYEVNRSKRLHFAFYPPRNDIKQGFHSTSQATVLDLFAGAGGMNLGFHAAGFKTSMAVEKNSFAVQTLSEHVNRIFPGDVESFLSASRHESYRSQIGRVHHIHASPPCQGFSAASRNGGCNDIANNNLSLLILEGVEIYKPVTASYEMVTGILREKHRWYLEKIIHDLVANGYKVRCCILNASDYGDPQNRKRLVLYAAAHGVELPRIPPPTHGEARHLLPRRTVRDAIGDLPQPSNPDTSEMIHNGAPLYNTWHARTSLSPGDANVVVLNPDEPAFTIRGGSTPPLHYQPGQDNSDEYNKYRCISLREMAMLQSFPMDFKFWGSKREQRKQVGNAVPIKLATAIAKSVHDSLTLVK